MELCGPADGIRLFNALRSRSLRTVYVCLGDKTGIYSCETTCAITTTGLTRAVYHILTLEQLTAQELLYKLAEKVGLQLCQVSCVLQLTSSGILVMVDDTVSASHAVAYSGTSIYIMGDQPLVYHRGCPA